MVVLYGSERPILFLDEEERGGEGGFGRADASGLQVLVEELVELFLFISVQGVYHAVQGGLRVGHQFNGMVPRLSFGQFVEVLLREQVSEGMIMFRDHFFEHPFRLVHVHGSSEFVGMMDAADDKFFIHSYSEDGVALLEFFVPTIIGVSVGEYELFSHAVAAAEDDCAAFPVHTRVMVFEPVMSEVNVLFSKVRDHEVNSFSVFSDCH